VGMKTKTKDQLIRELDEASRTIRGYEEAERYRRRDERDGSAPERKLRGGLYIVQDGKFRHINHYVLKISGYSREELIGRDPMNFVHPDDRRMVMENTKKHLRGDHPVSCVFRFVAKDGAIRWIDEIVRKTKYEGKTAILGNVAEVTERVASREKQEELETIEASILAAIPHAVIGLRDRRITFTNNGVKTVFGWDEDELIGKSIRILYRTDTDYEKMAGLYSKLKRRRTAGDEVSCRRKDGTDIECRVNASRIGDSLEDKQIVITYEDVTEQERAKEELEYSRQQLRDLSVHLQSLRERESARIARELHDELGQLLTALNMDLVMLERKIPPGQIDLVKRAESSIKLVGMTMNGLKRICMDLRPGMLDHLGLPAAIRWQTEEFQKRSGIQSRLSIKPEEFSVSSDLSTTLFRIFQETLTNIMRHSEATEVVVHLKKTREKVELVVSDNGKGISPEDRHKINSFGLIGMRERVYYCGGTVSISGRPGRGTTVKVDIPFQKSGDRK